MGQDNIWHLKMLYVLPVFTTKCMVLHVHDVFFIVKRPHYGHIYVRRLSDNNLIEQPMKLLIHSKTSTFPEVLGIDKKFHPKRYSGCDYLPILGLKLCERSPRSLHPYIHRNKLHINYLKIVNSVFIISYHNFTTLGSLSSHTPIHHDHNVM